MSLTDRPDEEALVDDEHISRNRKAFTKQRLRSYLKNALTREAWNGAPWLVKKTLADEYKINTQVPFKITQEYQQAQRRAVLAAKKSQFEGVLMNLPPTQGKLPVLKPKGRKNGRVNSEQFAIDEYQRALEAHPEFRHLVSGGQQVHFARVKGQAGFMIPQGDFLPLAAKPSGAVKPPPPPPPPKYPIEDLELAPSHGSIRPPFKYLSQDLPFSQPRNEAAAETGIRMAAVGPLLETWMTLNVFCQVLQLDSFTFDDYVDALTFTVEDLHCELLIEIHCALLKRLVNDVNDKNGQVHISLPEMQYSDSEASSFVATNSSPPSPEPEAAAAPARSTRSSLRKSGVDDLKNGAQDNPSSAPPLKLHRANDIDQYVKSYDWKARLRKRDLGDGKWIVIIVGLFNQLAADPKHKAICELVLSKLAPPDQEATPATAISQYNSLDINTRVQIVQLLCELVVGTRAIRDYMEDCTRHMTDLRKEKVDFQRSRKAA